MDNGGERPAFDSRFEAFKYWFVNVFWYHYKVIALVVILSAAALIFLVSDYMNTTEPDMVYLIVTNEYLDDTSLEWISELAAELIGDINGDSKLIYQGQAISMNEALGELAVVNGQRLIISMHEAEHCLYIFEEEYGGNWSEAERCLDLSDYGKTAEGKPWVLDVSAFMLERFGFEGTYYAVVEKVMEGMEDDAGPVRAREAALDMLRLVIMA